MSRRKGNKSGKLKRQQAKTRARRERRQAFETQLETIRKQTAERRINTMLTSTMRNVSAQAFETAQEAAAEMLERQRTRNDRSAANFSRNIGLMMEGKPSGLKRNVTESTPFMGVAALYATERFWRGKENGYQNWSTYAREGIANEKGVNVRDVNLWTEVKTAVSSEAYKTLTETMLENGEVTIGPGGVPMYKGKELSTMDDAFQAAMDTGNYTISDLIALIRSSADRIRW